MTSRDIPCRKWCPALFRHGDAGAVCHGVLKAKPSVDLTYSLSDSDKFSSSVDHRRSSSLSLTLSVPIYDGYKDENNFDIEKYEYQKKLLTHKDLKKDLLNTYLESWNNYNFYLQKIENQNAIIDTLNLKLKGDEILYKSQMMSNHLQTKGPLR